MGDLNGKHGLLTIGSERRVFTDINLPLIGNYSVMGRSIVIFSKNESNIPLACGNIKPDIHLVGNVAIKKNPAFTVGKFMQHMISLLNTTSWLVVPDAHATKDILNNECVQLTVNFYGKFHIFNCLTIFHFIFSFQDLKHISYKLNSAI